MLLSSSVCPSFYRVGSKSTYRESNTRLNGEEYAVTCFSRSVAVLSQLRCNLYPRSDHVVCVLDKVAMGACSSRVPPFFLSV